MGFIVADDLKREFSEKTKPLGKANSNQTAYSPNNQLEAFQVAELARDSFDSAIRYVHSMENNVLKLTCLIQIAQVLSQPNF